MQAKAEPWYRGLTRYQWLVLTVAWLGWVFDIADTAIFALCKGPMLKEMIGEAQYALTGKGIEGEIQTIFLIGWSIGGLVFGIMADKWGRTRTLIFTILIYSALTALTSFAQTVPQLMWLRFFTGIGIGGEWAAGAALIAEVFPNKARAPAASFLQSAAAIGPVLAAFGNAYLDWRVLFLVGALPALLTVVVRIYVKEPERAVKVEKRADAGSLKAIFSDRTLARYAIVAIIIGVVGIAGATNLSFWMPNLVEAASQGVSADVLRSRKSDVTYIMHIGTLAGVIVFPWLCQIFGRRRSFAAFFIASPLSLALITYGNVGYEQLKWLSPVTSFFVLGLTAGYALYLPELFPTHLRATGAGLAYNTGRVATAPFPTLTAALMKSMGNNAAIGVLLAGSIYVLGVLALPFAPETKGKGLPDSPDVH